jgi:aspartate carbamoyltransferase regulatory subunit
VNSRRLGTKDLIKIEGSYLTSREIDLIGLVSPSATLNIIENWRVKEKKEIKPPEKIEGIFKCPNPLCKSNSKYTSLKALYTVEISEDIRSSKLHCNLCGSITYYGSVLEQINREDFTMEGGGLVSREKIERVFLDLLLRKGALRLAPTPKSPFILKSGRPSPYFINLGALTDGESLAKVKWAFASYVALLLEEGKIEDFDYVFGPSYKGISLATLTCEGLNELYGIDKRYMYDRKEEKAYGDLSADRIIVGAGYFKEGERILIVDDTITTGSTKLETFEKLKLLGKHRIVGLVIAVDRQERMGDSEHVEETSAVENIEKEMGIKIFSIENIETIYSLIKENLDEDMRRLWVDYYKKYGTVQLE